MFEISRGLIDSFLGLAAKYSGALTSKIPQRVNSDRRQKSSSDNNYSKTEFC